MSVKPGFAFAARKSGVTAGNEHRTQEQGPGIVKRAKGVIQAAAGGPYMVAELDNTGEPCNWWGPCYTFPEDTSLGAGDEVFLHWYEGEEQPTIEVAAGMGACAACFLNAGPVWE